MKLIFVRPYPGENERVLAQLGEADVMFASSLSEVSEALAATVEILSVFVDTKVTEADLDRFTNLKCIATRSAGFDHIAVAEAKARGVVVTRVPHYGSQTVAEFAFALMFALSRNAYQSFMDMKQTAAISDLSKYEGFDLGGKTLGVVGTGMIGQRVCSIARSFGMKVIAFDQFPNDMVKALGIAYVPLAELMEKADIVTLHVPGRPETRHLINADMLTRMKPSSYLINTARGEVVDTRALVVALREKKIAGAGLDVLEHEHELAHGDTLTPEQKNDAALLEILAINKELIAMDNVVVTPHIAFDTREAKEEITDITVKNIRAFMGGKPINEVTL